MRVTSRLFSIALLVVVISVVAMVLFPMSTGPFSSTNGPATAFRAMRQAVHVQQEIQHCGLALCAVVFFHWIRAFLLILMGPFSRVWEFAVSPLLISEGQLSLRC